MRIPTVANTSVFRLSSITRSETAVGKLALPVDSSLVLYSRFKHVHGTPSTKGGTALPLSSLRAMDNLIDRLIALKGRNRYLGDVGGMSAQDIDFAVKLLQKELNGIVSGPQLPVTAGSGQNDIGLVLNLVA